MKELLYRANIHSKKSEFSMFLLIWGTDSMEVINQLDAIIGPRAEYKLVGIRPMRHLGQEITRDRTEGGDENAEAENAGAAAADL